MTRKSDLFPPLAPQEPERGGNSLGGLLVVLAAFAAGLCVGVLV